MDPCDFDPDCFDFWPDHDFRGFHDYHEGFAKDSLTNQTCGVIKGKVTRWLRSRDVFTCTERYHTNSYK